MSTNFLLLINNNTARARINRFFDIHSFFVTTQEGRLKTVRKSGKMAHFEAMFDVKVCCIFAKVRVKVLLRPPQPKTASA